MKTASIAFLVIIANVIIWYLPVFPFVPVFNIKENSRDQEWRRMPFKLSENEFLAVSRALSDGAEHYFKLRSKHKVLITLSLFMDTELLGNYTSKAGLACPDLNFKMDCYGLWVEKRKQGLKSEDRSGTVPARFN